MNKWLDDFFGGDANFVVHEVIANRGPDPGSWKRFEYRGRLMLANEGVLMAVKKGPADREKRPTLRERLSDSEELPEIAGELAAHAIKELGGTIPALGFILATTPYEKAQRKKRWARMLDHPDTFGIPASSITRMEVQLPTDVRGNVVPGNSCWLVITSEDEKGRAQHYCFSLGLPALGVLPPQEIPGPYAGLMGQIWEVRFRYELFLLIWHQLVHYLPAETPIKVLLDWGKAWLSKMPLTESVSALNVVLAATPGNPPTDAQRYDDIAQQAFYHLQRFKAIPSIAKGQAQMWADRDRTTTLAPVCFRCWARHVPFTRDCLSCGAVLQ